MFLVSECKKTAGRIEHSAPDAEAAPSPQDSAEETKKLALKTTLSDEELAQEFILQSMEKLRVSDLRVFREACQHLLTWWESDRGQVHGLMIEQHGDVNSAAGRMTIRKKRDWMNQRILQPFKEFYHALNVQHQKASKEMSTYKRQNGSPTKEKTAAKSK